MTAPVHTDVSKSALTTPPTVGVKPPVARSIQVGNKPEPRFIKRVLPRGHFAQIKTISDLYPQHEQLKAIEVLRLERERITTILEAPVITDGHELLAWEEILTLRGKLQGTDFLANTIYRKIRGKLYKKFMSYADEIAKAYFQRLPYRPLAGLDDLKSDAYVGLANCVDVFDYRRFSPFESNDSFRKFSRKRIKGAITDGLRTMQPFSRSISKLKREVNVMMITLGNKLGHHPTDSEFCEAYGESWWETLANPLLHASVYNQVSSCTHTGSLDFSEDDPGASDAWANLAVEDTSGDSLQRLQGDNVDDICRVALGEGTLHYDVIFYYFFFGCNLRKIVDCLRQDGRKISIPQVNKIKSEALAILRTVPGFREQLESISRKD